MRKLDLTTPFYIIVFGWIIFVSFIMIGKGIPFFDILFVIFMGLLILTGLFMISYGILGFLKKTRFVWTTPSWTIFFIVCLIYFFLFAFIWIIGLEDFWTAYTFTLIGFAFCYLICGKYPINIRGDK